MAKTTRRKPSRSTTRRPSSRSSNSNDSLLGGQKGMWGKDQPMVLALSAGIVILIVLALFLTGWL